MAIKKQTQDKRATGPTANLMCKCFSQDFSKVLCEVFFIIHGSIKERAVFSHLSYTTMHKYQKYILISICGKQIALYHSFSRKCYSLCARATVYNNGGDKLNCLKIYIIIHLKRIWMKMKKKLGKLKTIQQSIKSRNTKYKIMCFRYVVVDVNKTGSHDPSYKLFRLAISLKSCEL